MTKIVLEIDDNKIVMLISLLNSLNLIKNIHITPQPTTANVDANIDFFSLAGIWENREINSTTLRQQAWPDHQK